MPLAVPLLRLAARLLRASWRIEHVAGETHLSALLDEQRAFLPCCWHQRLTGCVSYLLEARARGLRPGFLVSPSRDGELTARLVTGLGATVVRGSATRTGARALRALYVTLREGISPIIHPDGPHGPANRVKSGTVMLAQMTRAPLLPLAFSADRYWQLKSWDRVIIPKPFARVTLVIGAPQSIARGEDLDSRAAALGDQLDTLSAEADRMAGAKPIPGRRGRKRDEG